jgi:hypothetical protein
MKTKTLYFTLIFNLVVLATAAQTMNPAKPSFAILGGLNFQNMNGKDGDGDRLENDLLLGYHVGGNVQIPVAPEFYFQPGLLLTTKGAKNSFGSIENKFRLTYLEMPLNFVYKAQVGDGYVMLGFGPYIGYGIGGKAIFEEGSVKVETDVRFDKEVDSSDPLAAAYFKPFDAGGNIFFGYELPQGIFVQLNTQLGMVKINPEYYGISNDKTSIKNTGFGISVGYRLN